MYMFREGEGANGELPPNNWESVFGGPAWTRTTNADGAPGQWYLHLFDSSQPDFDWTNPRVHSFFLDVLRFWLDKGVDGFRVDVAHGLTKEAGLPDFLRDAEYWASEPELRAQCPYFGHPGVHPIYREWRRLLDSYPGDRILCAEAFVEPLTTMAEWVRSDEMHQAFNFPFLVTRWEGERVRSVINESLAAFGAVGAPSTWVLSNHDQIRHATRLAIDPKSYSGDRITGIGPNTEPKPDTAEGLRRARAASAMMLALPGCAYIYNGEELGLPEATAIPDEFRQDPTFFRTQGEAYGRDGCRVPIPWVADAPAFGFNETGEAWLPQPASYREYARDAQVGVRGSTLEMYMLALRIRREVDLGDGTLRWLDGYEEDVLAFCNGEITVIANYSEKLVPLPAGDVVLDTSMLNDSAASRILAPETTVWIRA
jgi:alpha-glucosidase